MNIFIMLKLGTIIKNTNILDWITNSMNVLVPHTIIYTRVILIQIFLKKID